MSRLQKILVNGVALFITAGVLYGAYYYYAKSIPPKPCSTVLTYRVGDVDSRFGISREDFAASIAAAANVWNTAEGRTLIAESATSILPVSLVYDTRQQTVELGSTISNEQAAYNAQKSIVDTRRAALDAAQARYTQVRANFEAAAKAHAEKVDAANARGGATPSEYAALTREQKELEATQASLNAQADALNAQAADMNAQIKSLNALAQNTNQKVDVYNQDAHKDFDQGLYVRDDQGTRVTIYEFKTRGELTRVLTHELGHALGLDHNQNPASIMYPYNSGSSLTLSADDLAALNALCSPAK